MTEVKIDKRIVAEVKRRLCEMDVLSKKHSALVEITIRVYEQVKKEFAEQDKNTNCAKEKE